MNEKSSRESGVLLRFSTLFERALDVIKPPFMKCLVVLVGTVLVYLLFEGEIGQSLGLVLPVAVVLIFAFLAAVLQYAEMRFRYTKLTEEQLKQALRDVVMELQEEKVGRLPSLGIRITYLECNSSGDDIQGDFVRIENSGRTVIDMTNWTLHDEADHRFVFPALTLRPGAYVRVWTKAGTNTATDLFWGSKQAVWNEGDCAYLRDSAGTLIADYRYGGPPTNRPTRSDGSYR